MTNFADRVKTRRTNLGLTQEQVAKISGLKQPDISKIELGLISETAKILGLAKALECSPEWLSTGKGLVEHDQASSKHAAHEVNSNPYKATTNNIRAALDTLESALTLLNMDGREKASLLLASFARSPGSIVKSDIATVLAQGNESGQHAA